jgi:hypothetical protein
MKYVIKIYYLNNNKKEDVLVYGIFDRSKDDELGIGSIRFDARTSMATKFNSLKEAQNVKVKFDAKYAPINNNGGNRTMLARVVPVRKQKPR